MCAFLQETSFTEVHGKLQAKESDSLVWAMAILKEESRREGAGLKD